MWIYTVAPLNRCVLGVKSSSLHTLILLEQIWLTTTCLQGQCQFFFKKKTTRLCLDSSHKWRKIMFFSYMWLKSVFLFNFLFSLKTQPLKKKDYWSSFNLIDIRICCHLVTCLETERPCASFLASLEEEASRKSLLPSCGDKLLHLFWFKGLNHNRPFQSWFPFVPGAASSLPSNFLG